MRRTIALLCIICFGLVATGWAEEPPAEAEAADPLAPFERLIGGQWEAEGSFQKFEWGVGGLSVKTQSFFLVEGEPKLVSEGLWLWHPGEQKLKGYVTAMDMPVSFFDYTTRVDGDTMVHDLRSFSSTGEPSTYQEIWRFIDDTHYEWSLFQVSEAERTKIMGGTYTKK